MNKHEEDSLKHMFVFSVVAKKVNILKLNIGKYQHFVAEIESFIGQLSLIRTLLRM